MSEHDNTEPAEPDPATADQPAAAAAETRPPAPLDAPPPPAAETKPRWRDRVFRMRAVSAVALAGVILGAAGGSVTTALVSGDGHGRDEHFRIGQQFGPGMPMIPPPDGRQRFPGDESEDGGLPGMPAPPGSEDGTGGDTDGSADQESSLSES